MNPRHSVPIRCLATRRQEVCPNGVDTRMRCSHIMTMSRAAYPALVLCYLLTMCGCVVVVVILVVVVVVAVATVLGLPVVLPVLLPLARLIRVPYAVFRALPQSQGPWCEQYQHASGVAQHGSSAFANSPRRNNTRDRAC